MHRIRSINLSRYARVVQGLGIDPAEMFRKVGIEHSWLNMPDMFVPEKIYAELLDLSGMQMHGTSLGVLMGSSWRLSDFGQLSLLLQHQPDLTSMFQTLKAYSHLISTTVAIETLAQGKFSIIQFNLNTESENPGRHRIEVGVTALLCLCRHLLGKNWNPVSTHFSHGAPSSTRNYQQVIGNNIVFASDFDGIVVSEHDMKFIHADHDHCMEEHARRLMDLHMPRPASEPIEQRVRNTLQSLLPHGVHGIRHVSGALGCTVRSLQRQLESHNTSFQDALDMVRSQAAVRALRNPLLSITDVASQVGFGEISSFTRWFIQHFEQSPSSWRQQHVQNQYS